MISPESKCVCEGGGSHGRALSMVPVIMDRLQLCEGTAGLGAGQECTGFLFSSKHTHTHTDTHKNKCIQSQSEEFGCLFAYLV